MRSIEERYWKKVVKGKPGECWDWNGSTVKGYGEIGIGRHGEGNIYAHRLSWMIHFGPIPEGKHVLHKCDNPPCTNPDHLFLGTHQDNMDDCKRKGRFVRYSQPGEFNPSAKITEVDVLRIRKLRKQGKKIHELATMFGISKASIGHITCGRNWGDFEGCLTKEERERISKNNKVRGSKHPRAKLTEEKVRDIKIKGLAGANQHDLARFYGVPASTICNILRGKRWKHVIVQREGRE